MSPTARFSVVMPAYNAAATITSAIGSVLAQTIPDVEVIVVDDGSTDGTSAVVSALEDPRVRLIDQCNRGPSAARNTAIALATGKYVAFLDSDDLYLPRYLELAERALESTPQAGFAYTDAYVFDAVTGRVRRRSAMARNRPPVPPPEDREAFLLELLRRNFIFTAVTIPRTVLEGVGGFDESLSGSEDYELWLRIILRGYGPAWIPGCHVLYRKHPAQFTRNLATVARSVSALYDSLRMEDMPGAAHRELLARRRQEARRAGEVMSRFGRLVPLNVITRLKRVGVGESWYDAPPADVAAAFPDLSAV